MHWAKFFTRPILWCSLLFTLITSRYTLSPILKIPIIVMDSVLVSVEIIWTSISRQAIRILNQTKLCLFSFKFFVSTGISYTNITFLGTGSSMRSSLASVPWCTSIIWQWFPVFFLQHNSHKPQRCLMWPGSSVNQITCTVGSAWIAAIVPQKWMKLWFLSAISHAPVPNTSIKSQGWGWSEPIEEW